LLRKIEQTRADRDADVLNRLRIYRERLQAGLDDFLPNTSLRPQTFNLGGRRLAKPECFFHALRGKRKAVEEL